MKDDEKQYFIQLYNLRNNRELLRALCILYYSESKRFRYILEKWSNLGFWESGVTVRSGWFVEDKIPDRYLVLVGAKLKEVE